MENYINIFIATLQHLGHLTEDEGKRLADHIKTSTIPATYDEVQRLIGTILNKAKNPVKLADAAAVKATTISDEVLADVKAAARKK